MKVKYLLFGITVLFIVGLLTTSSYAKLDPKTCVGMWLLDDNKGDTAADSSGTKNDGKLVSNPKWVDGKVGKALEFDGAGSYVNIPNTESLNSPSFSICFWFKPNVLRIQGLADKTPSPQWRIFMNSTAGNIEFDALPGEIGNVTTPAAAVGRWDHVTATYDSASKTAKMYYNGTFSNQAVGVNMNTTSAVNINLSSPESTRLNGVIDDVAIFNVALEAADIQTIMDKGLKETLKPSAVDLSGKLAATWASIKSR
jgi:hypothetical protein